MRWLELLFMIVQDVYVVFFSLKKMIIIIMSMSFDLTFISMILTHDEKIELLQVFIQSCSV